MHRPPQRRKQVLSNRLYRLRGQPQQEMWQHASSQTITIAQDNGLENSPECEMREQRDRGRGQTGRRAERTKVARKVPIGEVCGESPAAKPRWVGNVKRVPRTNPTFGKDTRCSVLSRRSRNAASVAGNQNASQATASTKAANRLQVATE